MATAISCQYVTTIPGPVRSDRSENRGLLVLYSAIIGYAARPSVALCRVGQGFWARSVATAAGTMSGEDALLVAHGLPGLRPYLRPTLAIVAARYRPLCWVPVSAR